VNILRSGFVVFSEKLGPTLGLSRSLKGDGGEGNLFESFGEGEFWRVLESFGSSLFLKRWR
jgi:hypothetical protein